MKLGITGWLPGDPKAMTPAALKAIKDAGFSGFGVNFRTGVESITDDVAANVGKVFADSGLDAVELGMYSTTLVHPDAAVRAANVDALAKAIKVAAKIGRPGVITGSGSLNAKSQWFPHPENHGEAAHERLVASLKEAVKVAEDYGIILGLECHTFTALYSAESAKRTIDEVGSKNLKVHLDVVNWITWETVYRTGEAIKQMFALLAPDYILGAHMKGIEIEDKLVIHMNETVAGAETDVLDHVTYLQEMAKMPADSYLVIEHTPVDQIPATRDFVLAKAKEAGVSFA